MVWTKCWFLHDLFFMQCFLSVFYTRQRALTWRRQVEESVKKVRLKIKEAADRTRWREGVRAIAEGMRCIQPPLVTRRKPNWNRIEKEEYCRIAFFFFFAFFIGLCDGKWMMLFFVFYFSIHFFHYICELFHIRYRFLVAPLCWTGLLLLLL